VAKTWFITSASNGFGREWAEAALGRGDNVAATAHKLTTQDSDRRNPRTTGTRASAPTAAPPTGLPLT
jgi:NAD(P)-dependent dehydrogenase (short-subunit alcohol dehydrogenase family)